MSSELTAEDAGKYFTEISKKTIYALDPDILTYIEDSTIQPFAFGPTYESTHLHSGFEKPSKEEFEAKFNEYDTENSKYAMVYVKEQRDAELTVSDKYVLPDYPHKSEEIKQAWLDYRQALRDLPSKYPNPIMYMGEEFRNVTFPTPPE